MGERPRFFDDLAGVAGGAFSALAGAREELEGLVRARMDEAIRKLDLVKREDLEAVQEVAAAAQAAAARAEARVAALEAKVAGLGPDAGAVVPPVAPPVMGGAEQAPAASPPAATDLGGAMEPPMVD